ncbi:PTI1-like tyrosine-protein kinase [Senna tora]|uniref:PTI1-like tyrosine-protein kinase n=1 Tax=Senna tora TaxID=362788 RepID=A0A834WEA0_9FABA|nr:PTI1-like tyrosine-protein kinase [Senna tora]KAF7816126.1 PTI1-like tyrosine-protein kinase [Senna tora]
MAYMAGLFLEGTTSATNNFNYDNKLGERGFGSV